MNFTDFNWADSDLESIQIEYDCAILNIWNDMFQKRFLVKCIGLAGINNLCIWDDTIIMRAELNPVSSVDSEFVRKIYKAYKTDYDYGGRSLNNGLIELKIELSNYIPFSVYCLNVEVLEA